jgi:hypothetical protein
MTMATDGVESARRGRLERWLRIQADAKPMVYQRVLATTEINNVSYWLEIGDLI